MAPSPHGAYWDEGQKLGYQDAGSWTLFKSTPVDRRKAAWLYAQFTVAKSVSLKKTHVGLTPIRDSDIRHESFTERASKLGGLVEFYRSPDRVRWSPTGVNVPDYPKLAQIWWQQIGDVNSGAFTPQQAMDRLAGEMDQVMARMQSADERANTYGGCGPRLNEEKDPSEWLSEERVAEGEARREAAGQDRQLRRARQALAGGLSDRFGSSYLYRGGSAGPRSRPASGATRSPESTGHASADRADTRSDGRAHSCRQLNRRISPHGNGRSSTSPVPGAR